MCIYCSRVQIMGEIVLFSRKIYTAGKNFTRPPVVTVATNIKSDPTLSFMRSEQKIKKMPSNLNSPDQNILHW